MDNEETPGFSPEIEALLKVLNDRQRRFVLSYVVHLNATKAAAAAGYSDNSLRSIGSENLTKPDISSAIGAILSQQTMSVAEALRRMTDWARGSVEPFLHLNESGKFTVNLSHPDARENLHLLRKVKQRTTVRYDENGSTEDTYTEIELHDAKDATAKLLEAHGKLPGAGAGTNVTIIQIPDNGR